MASTGPAPATAHETKDWWGTFDMEEGQTGRWRLGVCELWVRHNVHEWRVAYRWHPDPPVETAEVEVPLPPETPDLPFDVDLPGVTAVRHGFRRTTRALTISPALSDRAVIVRPASTLYVMADEQVTLYIGTPLWVRLDVGAPARLLQEVPSYRLSDTWFGPSTMEGELCYASRTSARLSLADLEMRPHRAVVPVIVRNRAKEPLLVERIRILVQYLALYQAQDGTFWTPQVTVERESSGDLAALHIDNEPPRQAVGARLVRAPRSEASSSLIFRAFGSFFKFDL